MRKLLTILAVCAVFALTACEGLDKSACEESVMNRFGRDAKLTQTSPWRYVVVTKDSSVYYVECMSNTYPCITKEILILNNK